MTANKFEGKNIQIEKEGVSVTKLAFDLNSNVGSLGVRVSVLDDVATKLKHLQDDMEESAHRGIEKFSFPEHHREVRVLAELMYWTMNELIKNQEETRAISEALVSEVRENPRFFEEKK